MQHPRAQPEGGVFTNQIQTEWMYYNCFVLWCVSGWKALLACVWHEERFYTAGNVLWNGAGGLAEKPWISMSLKSCNKKWLRELEKDYETINWLYCVVEKMPKHCIVSCIVCLPKIEDRIRGMKYFYVLGLLGWVIKKLTISWIMPSLALLLYIVLSMTICNYM